MTVNTYFGTAADFIFANYPINGQDAVILAPGTVKTYTAVTGGSQYDMTVNGQTVSSLSVGSDGQIPAADIDSVDPDGEVWVSINDGPRVRAVPQGQRGATGATGPKGDTGLQGPKGDTGSQGPQGLPGVNAVPADNAVASYVSTPGTATQVQLAAAIDGRATAGANLPASNGSNDTTALNAVLAARSGEYVIGRRGEHYFIDGPLVLGSGTTLDMTGCTVELLPSASQVVEGATVADCRMVMNENAFSGRFVQDGATTASGTTLTSATAAFSAADIGQSVRVWDAGSTAAEPPPLDATITAVTSGTTVTLSTAAPVTTTGRPIYIGPRDSDISIIGGSWIRNIPTAPQSDAGWMYAHGFLFRHCDGVTLREQNHTVLGNKYMVNFGDGVGLNVAKLSCDVDSDGVHITGPARTIAVRDVFGTFGDDSVAFCTGEVAYGNGAGDTQGNIYDMLVDNVTNDGAHAVVKLAGSSYGYTHKRLTGRRLTHLKTDASNPCVAIAGDTGAPVTDDLVFEDIAGYNYVSSGTHGRITFRDVVNDTATGYGVQVMNAATVRALTIDGLQRDASRPDVTAIMINGAGVTVDSLHASACRWPVRGGFIVVNTNATVGKVYLDGVAYVPSTTSSGGALISVTSTCTVSAIHAAGCRSDGAFGFDIANGTTSISIGGGVFFQTVAANNAATLTLSGAWEQTSTGNQRGGSALIRSWSPSWRCHIQDLSADVVGTAATNRNSGLSCGLGPVQVVAANKWQNLATGAVYAPAGPSTVSAGGGAGTGATASLSGTDGGGTVTVTTGTGPAAGAQATFNCLTSWGATPRSITVTPTNAAAQAAGLYVSAKSATSWTVSSANAPTGNMTFDFAVRL